MRETARVLLMLPDFIVWDDSGQESESLVNLGEELFPRRDRRLFRAVVYVTANNNLKTLQNANGAVKLYFVTWAVDCCEDISYHLGALFFFSQLPPQGYCLSVVGD